jgi:hypothetical protein
LGRWFRPQHLTCPLANQIGPRIKGGFLSKPKENRGPPSLDGSLGKFEFQTLLGQADSRTDLLDDWVLFQAGYGQTPDSGKKWVFSGTDGQATASEEFHPAGRVAKPQVAEMKDVAAPQDLDVLRIETPGIERFARSGLDLQAVPFGREEFFPRLLAGFQQLVDVVLGLFAEACSSSGSNVLTSAGGLA